MLALLGVLVALGGLAALVALGKEQPGLLFIPLLGYGYVAASLLIHPLILMSYTPVDVLRHWSSGVPYVAVTLTYVIHRGWSYTEHVLPAMLRWVALTAVAIALSLGIFYEIERLARPEWYLGGKWSLLWTGGSYPLVDVMRDPVPLPGPEDTRSGEELRLVQSKQLEPYDNRHTNASEPYHWASLIIALFGLFHTALANAGALRFREPRTVNAVGERLAPIS
jgi:hypothetical protein